MFAISVFVLDDKRWIALRIRTRNETMPQWQKDETESKNIRKSFDSVFNSLPKFYRVAIRERSKKLHKFSCESLRHCVAADFISYLFGFEFDFKAPDTNEQGREKTKSKNDNEILFYFTFVNLQTIDVVATENYIEH